MKGNFTKKLCVFVTFILVILLLSTNIFALEAIATSKFIVNNDVIMRISDGTTVEQFLNDVTVNSGANKAVYKDTTQMNGTDLLATGMLLKVGNDTTYKLAVRGDANGDAKVSATDLSLFKMHSTNLQLLEGVYENAIDINCDLKVSMTDLSLLRMILVGMALPGTQTPTISGDITILPETTNYVKELGINVYWPEDTTGLTKQVSIDNGITYQNYTDKVTMNANNTVIARLIDQNNTVVKSASLVVTNIDNGVPEAFTMSVDHRISNYTTLTGETKDGVSGIAGYYFSYDNGTTWVPAAGQLRGKYVFTDVPANATLSLRMKASDKVGNETLTDAKQQRTFKKGIEILNEKLTGVTVDVNNGTITMPDERVFRLAITEKGGYAVLSVGQLADAEEQLEESKMLNEKIAAYEEQGVLSVEEILTKLTAEGLGEGTVDDGIFTTEKADKFIQYRLVTNINDKHEMVFEKIITKNPLTSSGQMAENEMLIDLEDLIVEMKKENANVTVLEILDKAVENGLILEENVNRNNGRFETEVGLTYEITKVDGEYQVELIGFATDVEDGYIQEKILSILEDGLKNQIIDWAIEDGLTTEDKTSRVNGMYEATDGGYKQVVIDFEEGTYTTVDITKPEGAIIEYTLTPDFPTMTNKTVLGITAKGEAAITKIEVYTELGEALLSKTYTDNQLTKSENVDITYNGTYLVKVTTSDGKVSEKEILVSNIASILPIRVTITPESPRNTVAAGIQNGIATGPITVTLKYSAAPLLENEDKYQYQLYTTTGEWQTAGQEQLIENITKNCKIYARYFDGEKSVKQIEIVIDTVDNVAPNAFEYTTEVTSNSITVTALTEDTAADSEGTVSRDGVQGIGQYLYKLDDGEWQADNVFENLEQNKGYAIHVKAIDHAGNETSATNSGANVKTEPVPNASDVITFEYSTTAPTKENVIVKFNSTLDNEVYTIQYQAISDGSTPVEENWLDGKEYEATGNCKIYVRLIDSTKQTNTNYAIGTVANIDNMGPIDFTPKAIATTKDSITIKASSVDPGEAKDTPKSDTTECSGTAKYDYYITGTSGMTTKIENQTEYTYTFTGLEQGSIYSIYVIATDTVGNSTQSEAITVVTNGTLDEYTNVHTTINGLIDTADHDNPIIPSGFAPVNEGGVEWGDGSTKPADWNKGLVIRDRDGNEFVWVPVDETDVTFTKWLTDGISYNDVMDGTEPIVNENELSEQDQITKYGGFYVARYEASKNSDIPMSKKGETPWVGKNYANAKEKAEEMYNSNVLQSGLVTGTQWDTMMKWISNANADILTSKENGNFTGTRADTGSSDTYLINNIYDLSGNVQEITNEIQGTDVVVRGGAYNEEKTLKDRYVYGENYTNSNLGFRTVLYVIETEELEPTDPGVLGIGNINKGPGHITINGGAPSYCNPVVPVGFKAVNTTDADWYGLPTPRDWNKGLVIEDENGNQFVWVPVDGNMIKYEKWYTIYAPMTIKQDDIEGDILPLALEQLNVTEKQQIENYGGFYVARYEAGNFEGVLSSKAGVRTVNAVTFAEAREYAEGMYSNAYVKSGLLTGTAWDTTIRWMSKTDRDRENRVLKDQDSGNNPNITFTFSGEYAEGPESPIEIRGEYKVGTNVTKEAGKRMLLATGLVEAFKTNNIYDMAGNVWEYTYEYTTNDKNQKEYIARGADYYRKYAKSSKWGAAIRENVDQVTGEKRNESGFRVMLYLVEGTAEIGKFEDYNRTMTGKPSTYNNPVVPSGFAPVNKGASWGNGTLETIEWDKGLVIEDQAGNEFVWVPVDKRNVEYERWTQTGISYKEVESDQIPEKVSEWNEKEITQIQKYGGFYIGRYEASKLITETEVTGASKANAEAWTNIDYVTAKQMAEAMSTKDNVSAGLVTGTAWDTAMRWIANEKGDDSYVIENSTSWGDYSNSDLGTNAQAKNIFLLAGGNWEWTAEKSGANAVYRGGVRTDRGDSSPAGYRGTKITTALDDATTFRMMLYVTGDVLGAVTKPVSDSEPLYGTKFPSIANEPELVNGMTPVKWNGVTWVTTTKDDPEWYSYVDVTEEGPNTSKWANAKTEDGSMWVWIPRYAYKIEDLPTPTGGVKNGRIHILFLDGKTNESLVSTEETIYAAATGNITSKTNYIVHPAFRGDTKIGGWTEELSGIWVGKFESSGNSPSTIASKPNIASFGYDAQGNLQFKYALQATLGTKNVAPTEPTPPIAYRVYVNTGGGGGGNGNTSNNHGMGMASYSYYRYKYNGQKGLTYTEAYNRYYEDFAKYYKDLEAYKKTTTRDVHMAKNTEWGAVAYLAHSKYGVNGATLAVNPTGTAGYEYRVNVNQSTTGNIYGIYDMAGGRNEYVSAYMGNWSEARFGNIVNIVRAPLKYKQVYETNSYYGDAMGETSGWQNSTAYTPNSYGYLIDHGTPRPLVIRGNETKASAGGNRASIFTASVQCSNTNFNYSFRMIIVPVQNK